MVWAAALAGLMSAIGQQQAAKRQNKKMEQWFSSQGINNRARGLNPWVYQAMNSPGFRAAYQKIAENPGYIDPKLKAYAFMQNDRGSQGALQRLGAMMGRSGNTGGMAQANALGALGMQGMGRARIANNFANMQAQLMRGDLQGYMNDMQQAQGQAAGIAGQQAGTYNQPTPWASVAGNAITGGLAAYGSMGQGGGGGQGGTPQTSGVNWGGSQGLGPSITPNNWYNMGRK